MYNMYVYEVCTGVSSEYISDISVTYTFSLLSLRHKMCRAACSIPVWRTVLSRTSFTFLLSCSHHILRHLYGNDLLFVCKPFSRFFFFLERGNERGGWRGNFGLYNRRHLPYTLMINFIFSLRHKTLPSYSPPLLIQINGFHIKGRQTGGLA